MTQNEAWFLANTIAGVHLVLIFYFLVGWLIPFMSLAKRCALNVVIAGSFLFFRFQSECPLTTWENYFRNIADPRGRYDGYFIQNNLTFLKVRLSDSSIDRYSLILNALILSTMAIILGVLYFKKVKSKNI